MKVVHVSVKNAGRLPKMSVKVDKLTESLTKTQVSLAIKAASKELRLLNSI
jgi:hypothetical protein